MFCFQSSAIVTMVILLSNTPLTRERERKAFHVPGRAVSVEDIDLIE